MREEILWVEIYRPKTVEECILPASIKDTFQEYVNQKKIPNLMLAGAGGTGKTSIARALCEEIGCDYLIINGSDENGIDVLRNKITNYATSVSLSGGRKVIIIDEADYMNCLEETQEIRVGTIDSWESIKLNDLPIDKEFPVVSFNLNTGELENDVGTVVFDGEEEVFEVELESGEIILVTADHPFIVDGFSERTISDGLIDYDVVVAD